MHVCIKEGGIIIIILVDHKVRKEKTELIREIT